MVTFDFGPEVYPQFLAELPEDTRERVRAALSRQPYEHIFPPDAAPMMTLVGDIGRHRRQGLHQQRRKLSYQPFIAEEFKCAWPCGKYWIPFSPMANTDASWRLSRRAASNRRGPARPRSKAGWPERYPVRCYSR